MSSHLQAVYINKNIRMCEPRYDLVKMTSEHIDDVMTLMIKCGRLEDCHKVLLYGLLKLYPGLSWGAVERETQRILSK